MTAMGLATPPVQKASQIWSILLRMSPVIMGKSLRGGFSGERFV
jgi:hypothetical protein